MNNDQVTADQDFGTGYSDGRGPFMQMQSGKRYHPLDPRADEIDINDMATGLSRLVRYSGQTGPQMINVADHSTNVADVVRVIYGGDWAAEMAGLLHDAPEYILGDKVRPVKAALESLAPGVFKDLEQRQWQAVVAFVRALGFDFPEAIPDIVWKADNYVLQTEINFLIQSGVPWQRDCLDGYWRRPCSPKSSGHSREYFLVYWESLLLRADAPRLEAV